MNRVLIIAEAGVNHNGSLKLAKELALTAKECGADIVKFQTAKLSSLVSKNAKMADYQKNNIGQEMSQKEMLEKLLLTYDEFVELAAYCKEIGIQFLSTPFDIDSVDFLERLNCTMWKIPSGEVTNLPYLEHIAKTHKKVILSTGMCSLEEIRGALSVFEKEGVTDITVLHCTTEYPAPFAEVNLRAMQTIASEFGYPVGYSDHTEGVAVPVAAVALGATVIEKHFTLDKKMEGPDHKASLEPNELKDMIASIRNIELALGSPVKQPTESEIKNRMVARKSIVAKTVIQEGEIFTTDNITTKRPGNGISPMKWYDILGKKADKRYSEDDLIEL